MPYQDQPQTRPSSKDSAESKYPFNPRWPDRLKEYCEALGLGAPQWQEVSDRRGGRTAWQVWVRVGDREFQPIMWRDGNYMENAYQCAAEYALRSMTGVKDPAFEPLEADYYYKLECERRLLQQQQQQQQQTAYGSSSSRSSSLQ